MNNAQLQANSESHRCMHAATLIGPKYLHQGSHRRAGHSCQVLHLAVQAVLLEGHIQEHSAFLVVYNLFPSRTWRLLSENGGESQQMK